MARKDKRDRTSNNGKLSKYKIGAINRGNRNISGNINTLMDTLNTMTYGIHRTDKVNSLMDDFNSLLKVEIQDMNSRNKGDTTSFITQLLSDNNKRVAQAVRTVEDLFSAENGNIQTFIMDQYKNKLIKYADLSEISSQLTELQEAITITRDAIISADIIDGYLSRNIKINNDDFLEDDGDYTPIIEKMEKTFEIHEKIKNFIVPKTLEFGEYSAYVIPYSKLFEDFSREKNGKRTAYSTISERTLFDIVNDTKKDELLDVVMESVTSNGRVNLGMTKSNSEIKKDITKELSAYMENITICNDPVPICILEEGVDSAREYYTEFVESTFTEKDDKSISFSKVMSGIDDGVHNLLGNNKKKKDKTESFDNIKDCYIKLIDPMHLLPIEIMGEVIGYYYIQEEDINALSGILTSTVYYDNFNNDKNQSNIISVIAETIVDAFDKKFLNKNIKFKKLIVEALNYYKLNNKKIRFQFIPKEYIIQFKVNKDENGRGTSMIEPSLFYGKLYLMLLIFKLMTIIKNSNDTKVNYIKQSGIDKNVSNKIQDIIRKNQQRQITLTDMFSYTTLINKIGQGSEMYVPVGASGERGIETEILSGQDVPLNTELLEMLKKAYISATGVPDVLLNYLHEAEFAKTLELANNRFHGSVVSYQLDFNNQITEFYKAIMRYSTTIPEHIIESFSFNFIQPKSSNSNITNDLLNNHNSIIEFLVALYFGQDGVDNPENSDKIKRFKKLVAEDRLSMLRFNDLDKLYDQACIEGTGDSLNPDTQNDNSEEG